MINETAKLLLHSTAQYTVNELAVTNGIDSQKRAIYRASGPVILTPRTSLQSTDSITNPL
jgi:hypothetical protein